MPDKEQRSAPSQPVSRAGLSIWPARILGPAPTLKEINLLCWGLFAALLLVPTYSVVQHRHEQGPLLQSFDADFVYFYAMGRLLNEYPVERLYDYSLQKKISDEVHPLKTGVHAPIPYPPYVGMLFQMFARLSYPAAYALWLSVSLLLYLAGLTLITFSFFSREPLQLTLIYCLALSFYPFAIELMLNGHLSAIGFLAIAVALVAENQGRPILSGLALSACLYKPTLLVLLVPMLLVTARFRTMLGFTAGGGVLFLVTTALKGIHIWPPFFQMLRYFSKASSGWNGASFLRLGKYVDLTSFSSLLPGGRSRLGVAVLIACFCSVAGMLLTTWWKSRGSGKPVSTLVWAATLTWMLVVNIYVPMYDTVLIVLSLILTAGVLKDLRNGSLDRWFALLAVTLYASYWVTERIADAVGVQVVTIVLCAIGTFQLVVLNRIGRLQQQTHLPSRILGR
jgi:hypothetical protein